MVTDDRRPKVADISDDEVLVAVREWWADKTRPRPFDALAAKYPDKVVLRKLGQMVDRGILDYGVSIRLPWVRTY